MQNKYSMRYQELIENVEKLEEKIGSTEPFYFEAMELVEDIRKDLKKLDTNQHLKRIVKDVFLVKWGEIVRVVNIKGLDWERLGETLRSLEEEFRELRAKKFLAIDFDEQAVSNAVRTIYGKLDLIPRLGGPTTISKILHLLNPEIFIMWDYAIREGYKKKNSRIRDTAEGYLEFLKEMHKEIVEALKDRQRETGKGLDEIENEVRSKYKNKTLPRIVDEYNYYLYHNRF